MSQKRIVVLRLGHRPFRDKRVTTHVGLVARAFGADGLILAVHDQRVIESIGDVRDRWGGEFYVGIEEDWRSFVRNWSGTRVHLTMYGEPIDDKMSEIRAHGGDLLVLVGAEKVPPDLYKLSDYNVAVGSQPHSEVAALALFLDRYHGGKQLKKNFNGETRIIPSRDGKRLMVE